MGLNNEEEDDSRARQTARGKHIAVAVVNSVDNVRGEKTDEEIPRPVGSCSKRHALGTVPTWVDLSHHCPHNRSPGHGKCGDEQTGEDDHDVADVLCVGWGDGVEGEVAQGAEDKEAHAHPEPAIDQRWAATVFFDNVETGECGCYVYGAENDGCHVWVW